LSNQRCSASCGGSEYNLHCMGRGLATTRTSPGLYCGHDPSILIDLVEWNVINARDSCSVVQEFCERPLDRLVVIPKEVIIDSFDRFFAFAGQACFTPWSDRPQVEHNDVRRARKTGLRWAKSVHLVRCGACPIHRIALRTAPARVAGFDSIKRVNS